MHNLRQLPHTFIVFIFITLIYSQQTQLIGQRVLAADTDDPDSLAPPPKPATSKSDFLETGDFSPQDKKKHLEHAREGIRRLLKLKDEPSDAITTSNTKLYIPRAMLEQYLQGRDEVKQFIPNDRDFLGKIDIDGLDYMGEDFWNQVYQRGGSYDLEIDMKPPEKDPDDPNGAKHKRDAEHVVVIKLQSDPEEVPKNIEAQLPPHVTSTRNQKQYMSVHLKFNLSQSVYSQLTTKEELSIAQLYLTYDKISSLLPLSKAQMLISSQNTTCEESNVSTNRGVDPIANLPTRQRLFFLLITGYDKFNEPTTTIFNQKLIDTQKPGPLVVDVSLAVRSWIKDPSKNYGIIVRVKNEDDLYEQQMLAKIRNIDRKTNPEEYDEAVRYSVAILEQVRLKRAFRQWSDDEEIWVRKQPYIMAHHKPPEKEHVKRHVGEDETDGMQSDDPNVTTEYHQSSTSTASSGDTLTERPSNANLQTSTFGSVTKREQTASAQGVRRGHLTRTSGNGRASSPQQGGTSPKPRNKPKPFMRQPDKCSKKPLKIDFDEVGWSSWIIAPHSFYANYCSGECTWPLADTQNATNHAIIQAIYHSVGRVVPKSCCAPVKLARMAILYQLDGIVQMRQYDDMIIEACGCL